MNIPLERVVPVCLLPYRATLKRVYSHITYLDIGIGFCSELFWQKMASYNVLFCVDTRRSFGTFNHILFEHSCSLAVLSLFFLSQHFCINFYSILFFPGDLNKNQRRGSKMRPNGDMPLIAP